MYVYTDTAMILEDGTFIMCSHDSFYMWDFYSMKFYYGGSRNALEYLGYVLVME